MCFVGSGLLDFLRTINSKEKLFLLFYIIINYIYNYIHVDYNLIGSSPDGNKKPESFLKKIKINTL